MLGDPEKRAAYDRFGEEGAEGGGGGPATAEDVFSMLFGGGMRRAAGPTGPRKTEESVMPLRVSLEDLFTGTTVKVPVDSCSYEKDAEGNIMDRAGNR